MPEATAGAFRDALETRLLERSSRDDTDLQRLRRQVAFDRLLARMFGQPNQLRDGWILKGRLCPRTPVSACASHEGARSRGNGW